MKIARPSPCFSLAFMPTWTPPSGVVSSQLPARPLSVSRHLAASLRPGARGHSRVSQSRRPLYRPHGGALQETRRRDPPTGPLKLCLPYSVCISICIALAFTYGIKSVLFNFGVSSNAHDCCVTVAVCVCVTFRSVHVAIENVDASHAHTILVVWYRIYWCWQL